MAKSLSIIIPAYNEENYLKLCLDSIAAQTEMPDEVIVVDNNSTDDTVKVARSYPFVKVLYETKQGQTHAQATGFRAAQGELLGRIDADTVLDPDWVRTAKTIFEADTALLAVTGGGMPYDLEFCAIGGMVFDFYHRYVSSVFSGHPMIWGSNCVLTSQAWNLIADEMSGRQDIWEDFEMSFLLDKYGKQSYSSALRVLASFRVSFSGFELVAYQYRAVRTFSLFSSRLRTTVFCMAWFTMFLLAPIWLADRALGVYRHGLPKLRTMFGD